MARALIRRGLPLATAALRHPRRGRFALQAAVAGLHAVAPSWAETDWAQIVTTYDALMRTWPSPVVALNRAAARSRLAGVDLTEVLREIDGLASTATPTSPRRGPTSSPDSGAPRTPPRPTGRRWPSPRTRWSGAT
jgi:predicted RNA polymerase sigma factor